MATLRELIFSGGGCFIYGLIDPRTGLIRYVGKASGGPDGLSKRLSRHCKEAQIKKFHRARWIASLLKKNLKPHIVVLEVVPFGCDWQPVERDWITFLNRRCDLTNTMPGGEGGPTMLGRKREISPEWRKKIADGRRGVPMPASMRDPEFLKRRGLAIRAVWAKRSKPGCEMSDEAKAKISAARRGKSLSEEHRKKLSQAKLGFAWSPKRRDAYTRSQENRR
jgi:hypothetical protein